MVEDGRLPQLGRGYSSGQRAEAGVRSIAERKMLSPLTDPQRRFWRAVLDRLDAVTTERVRLESEEAERLDFAAKEKVRRQCEEKLADRPENAFRDALVRRCIEDPSRQGIEPVTLPSRGRVPLATARRALTGLPEGTRACRITPEALRRGMEVEREHATVTGLDSEATARIAAAHLCERPDYYERLARYVEND